MLALLGLLVWDVAHQHGPGVAQQGRQGQDRRRAGARPAAVDRRGAARASPRCAGKVVVVNFWQSYCVPCKHEARDVAAAARAWTQAKDVVFLGVDVQDLEGAGARVPEALRGRLPERQRRVGTLVASAASPAVPETFFIDRRGRVGAAAHHRAGARAQSSTTASGARSTVVKLARRSRWRRSRSRRPRRASKHAREPGELEAELVCPTCHTPLDESDSPFAQQMKTYIRAQIAACQTEKPDQRRAGRASSARRCSRRRRRTASTCSPGCCRSAASCSARSRSAAAPGAGRAARDEQRADSARAGARRPSTSGASTRSSHASMIEKLPIAFLAGLVSVITPCVLPLVPGYLSAVSAVEVDRLGERGVGRRIVVASMPVHRRLHRRLRPARRRRGRGRQRRRQDDADEDRRVRARRARARVRRPAAVARARGRARAAAARAAARLGGAARRRVRGVRGAVHRHGARVDPRPRVGLGHDRARRRPAARLLARPRRGVRARRRRVRARDARVPLGARPLRASCGSPQAPTLVALGLLLFFHRDWWLGTRSTRYSTRIGLGTV